MAEFDLNSATTTDFTNTVPDFIVEAKALDFANPQDKEDYWYFENATKNFGYYLNIPEIFSAANSLANWAFTRGWETKNIILKEELRHVRGMGKDSFHQIIWNQEIVKLIVGDAFIEVKRLDNNKIANMIPISPERVRLVFGKKDGMLKRYDVWNGKDWKPIELKNMLHSINKRIGDSVHGQSQIEPAKFIIDFRNELLEDTRKLSHRDMALGIAYYKTSNTGKITFANRAIERAVKSGEMFGVASDTLEIKEFPSKNPTNKLELIKYTENFFYQIFGVPRSIATSDGTSEVGGKMGHVIFEPVYTKEQVDMEWDLNNQQKIDVTFNRPPILGGLQPQIDEGKNTGQVSIQPNDVTADLERE